MTRAIIPMLCAAILVIVSGAASATGPEIGHIKTVSGDASIVRDGDRIPAMLGEPVYESDSIETGDDGSIGITFTDNTMFSAGPNTTLMLTEFAYESSSFEGNMLADLLEGTLSVTSGDIAKSSPEAMRLRTPSAILGVRGTRFLVRVDPSQQ